MALRLRDRQTLRFAMFVFSPRDAMHKRGLCRRAVSVRPSVTFVYFVEASKPIFKILPKFLPHCNTVLSYA